MRSLNEFWQMLVFRQRSEADLRATFNNNNKKNIEWEDTLGWRMTWFACLHNTLLAANCVCCSCFVPESLEAAPCISTSLPPRPLSLVLASQDKSLKLSSCPWVSNSDFCVNKIKIAISWHRKFSWRYKSRFLAREFYFNTHYSNLKRFPYFIPKEQPLKVQKVCSSPRQISGLRLKERQ